MTTNDIDEIYREIGEQGYTTTAIPTTWMNDSSRLLCAFEHTSLLEGTMVLVSGDAPVCCCPRAFSQKDLLGEAGGHPHILLLFTATYSCLLA